ncbi:hypothetical protein Tco_0869784 [Tanacetum coccineum]
MLVQHQGEEPSIQTTPKTSPSKITSSMPHPPHNLPSHLLRSLLQCPMNHLNSVNSLGCDEGSMQQHELMDLVTKLILRVKKLEKNVKTGKARRRARIVISEDEDAAEDSSKQGRKISDIDTDPTISLVQPQQDMEYDFDATASIPITTAGLEISTANIAVSTADAEVTTASASISTVSPPRVSTAEDISGAETQVYIRRSASKSKDKGKAIMQESEPPKKIKKRVQVQMSIDEELAKKLDLRQNKNMKGLTLKQPWNCKRSWTKEKKLQLKKLMILIGVILLEDLQTLWKLVKTKHGDTRPEDEHERVLWGDLKVMFEPDIKSDVWRNLQGYKVTVWKLFDSCGVHFVRFGNVHIFMLVEKRYPLTPITITNMLNKKLQADYWNEMCYQLLKLMVKQQKGQ